MGWIRALSLAALMLLLGNTCLVAQSNNSKEAAPGAPAAPHVLVKPNVTSTSDEAKGARTPREVIKALRSALKSRLAVVRH